MPIFISFSLPISLFQIQPDGGSYVVKKWLLQSRGGCGHEGRVVANVAEMARAVVEIDVAGSSGHWNFSKRRLEVKLLRLRKEIK